MNINKKFEFDKKKSLFDYPGEGQRGKWLVFCLIAHQELNLVVGWNVR